MMNKLYYLASIARERTGDARRRARASTELRMGHPRMERGENPSFPRGLDLCRVDLLSCEPLKNMGVPAGKPSEFRH